MGEQAQVSQYITWRADGVPCVDLFRVTRGMPRLLHPGDGHYERYCATVEAIVREIERADGGTKV